MTFQILLEGLSSPSQRKWQHRQTYTYCIPPSNESHCLLSNYDLHNAKSLFYRNGKERQTQHQMA